MLNVTDKVLMEKVNQLKKAIEIVGGKSLLDKECDSNTKLLSNIVLQAFNKEAIEFVVNDKPFTIMDLMNRKLQYEKAFLKGKIKTLQSIVYKIKKYDTSLDSIIRRYKKTRSIEDYNKIYSSLEKGYRRDINLLVLMEVDTKIVEALTIDEEQMYYGEYLTQKKKQIIDAVISKMGIV